MHILKDIDKKQRDRKAERPPANEAQTDQHTIKHTSNKTVKWTKKHIASELKARQKETPARAKETEAKTGNIQTDN